MNPSKQDEAEDHAAALINVAAWFARYIVAVELGVHDDSDLMGIYRLPESFRQLVAAQMVIGRALPDNIDEALLTLGELYDWGPE